MPWFDCSCCPTNVVRLFPSWAATSMRSRPTASTSTSSFQAGATIDLGGVQPSPSSNRPTIPGQGLSICPFGPNRPRSFTLCLRIPGWSQGRPVPAISTAIWTNPTGCRLACVSTAQEVIRRHRTRVCRSAAHLASRRHDRVDATHGRAARVHCSEHVADNVGKVALERGPLVYCAEAVDNGGHAPISSCRDDAEASVKTCRSCWVACVASSLGPSGESTARPSLRFPTMPGPIGRWRNDRLVYHEGSRPNDQ